MWTRTHIALTGAGGHPVFVRAAHPSLTKNWKRAEKWKGPVSQMTLLSHWILPALKSVLPWVINLHWQFEAGSLIMWTQTCPKQRVAHSVRSCDPFSKADRPREGWWRLLVRSRSTISMWISNGKGIVNYGIHQRIKVQLWLGESSRADSQQQVREGKCNKKKSGGLPANSATLACLASYGHLAIPLNSSPEGSRVSI